VAHPTDGFPVERDVLGVNEDEIQAGSRQPVRGPRAGQGG